MPGRQGCTCSEATPLCSGNALGANQQACAVQHRRPWRINTLTIQMGVLAEEPRRAPGAASAGRHPGSSTAAVRPAAAAAARARRAASQKKTTLPYTMYCT